MSKGTVITLVIIGSILLAVANVALWASLDVFNPDRFGAHVAEGLQSPEATEALAGPIVDQLMVEYPDLPALAREAAVEVVAWLLQRPLFTPVIKETAALASTVMTTSAQDVVGIDLANSASDVGSTVVGVISRSTRRRVPTPRPPWMLLCLLPKRAADWPSTSKPGSPDCDSFRTWRLGWRR